MSFSLVSYFYRISLQKHGETSLDGLAGGLASTWQPQSPLCERSTSSCWTQNESRLCTIARWALHRLRTDDKQIKSYLLWGLIFEVSCVYLKKGHLPTGKQATRKPVIVCDTNYHLHIYYAHTNYPYLPYSATRHFKPSAVAIARKLATVLSDFSLPFSAMSAIGVAYNNWFPSGLLSSAGARTWNNVSEWNKGEYIAEGWNFRRM